MPTVREVIEKCEALGLEVRRNKSTHSHTMWDIVEPNTGTVLTGISGHAGRQGGDPNWYLNIRRLLKRAGFQIEFGEERKGRVRTLTRNPKSKVAHIAIDLDALKIAQERAAAAGERIPTVEDLHEHPGLYKTTKLDGSTNKILTDAATEEVIQNMAPGADTARVHYTVGRLNSFMERRGPELDARASERLKERGFRGGLPEGKGRNAEFARIAIEEVAPARDLQAWKSVPSGEQTLHNLLDKGKGASIWTLNLIEATMDHIDGLKFGYVDEARKGQQAVANKQKKEKQKKAAKPPVTEPATEPEPEKDSAGDIALQLVEEYEEAFRQIAMAAGADGTSPDDWRALVDKPKSALFAVQQLREDYDEADATVNSMRLTMEAAETELSPVLVNDGTDKIREEYAKALFGMLAKFDPKNADQYTAIFDRLDKLAGIS